jgi:hypothetical protein
MPDGCVSPIGESGTEAMVSGTADSRRSASILYSPNRFATYKLIVETSGQRLSRRMDEVFTLKVG